MGLIHWHVRELGMDLYGAGLITIHPEPQSGFFQLSNHI
jgi:hypothetical protein